MIWTVPTLPANPFVDNFDFFDTEALEDGVVNNGSLDDIGRLVMARDDNGDLILPKGVVIRQHQPKVEIENVREQTPEGDQPSAPDAGAARAPRRRR